MKVVVVGGGAAGFFGAITCATVYPHCQVTLLEAANTPLAKVRISGGGRCNVTHHCFEAKELVQYYPRGGKELRGAFSRFQPKDTIAWFESHGVRLKTEVDGRMFPVTDNSQTIVDCLLTAADTAEVKLRLASPILSVRQCSTGFEVVLKTGEIFKSDRLLLATGSNPIGYRTAKNLGHTVENPVPSLFTFHIVDSRLHELEGLSVNKVSVSLEGTKLEQTGPLLITHWGVSGPAILKLSAWGARILQENQYKMPLKINWLPEYNSENLRQYLLEFKSTNPKKSIYSYCPVSLPKRLWQRLITIVGINHEKPWAELSNQLLNQLVKELTQGIYHIKGKGVFKEEFVTCGGVSLKEIDFKTMESKICPGLYFAGEILNIDGITGGFNFQSAWTTGWLAGQAIGS